jgi:NAD(P)H-nitrite reductase large subunit
LRYEVFKFMFQDDSSPAGDEPGRMVCFCHCVREEELLAAIRQGADTLRKLQLETLAATGCGACEYDVLDLLKNKKRI